jgi:hypothetical protein
MGRCHSCGQELIEIDNRGRGLTGCLTCNLWTAGDAKGWTRLSEEDLRSLHQLRHGIALGELMTKSETLYAVLFFRPSRRYGF